jgi:hypothetical protein
VAVFAAGGALVVFGTKADNTIHITDDGNGGVSVTVDGGAASSFTGIKNIVVHGRDGNDTVNYQLTGPATLGTHLNLHLGNGNDTATLDFAAGVNSPRLKVDLDGGKGNDTVNATFGELTSGNVYFRANLGDGDDTFTGTLNGDVLAGAKLRVKVAGHKGNDTFTLNAAGADVAAEALLALDFDGDKGTDTFNVTYQGKVEGTLRLEAEGGKDNDTATVNLTLDTGSTGRVSAEVEGDKGDDNLTLNVNLTTATDTATVKAVLDGGKGTDTGVATDNVLKKGIEL